jgi:hypothetical protein
MAISQKKINYLLRRASQKVSHIFEDYTRIVSRSSSSQKVVNEKEIRVLGLRRSGNHAIINWIAKQVKGDVMFINHVKPLENPYRDQYESQVILGRKLDETLWNYREPGWWRREKNGDFSFKDCLLYSYEDQEIEKVARASFEQKHDLYLGKSEQRFDIIVMRDPFNLFASRLQSKPRDDRPNFSMLEVYSRRYKLPELWVSYAKECLSETSLLKHNKLFVNYNQWFFDIEYRKSLSAQLQVEFTDDGLNDVSISGRGSSFDGDKYAGEAYKMDVLNRWQLFADNTRYRQLFKTAGVQEYSEKLFGHIPGTEVLFS